MPWVNAYIDLDSITFTTRNGNPESGYYVSRAQDAQTHGDVSASARATTRKHSITCVLHKPQTALKRSAWRFTITEKKSIHGVTVLHV